MESKSPMNLLAGGLDIIMAVLLFLVPFAVINEILYSNFLTFSSFWVVGQYEYASISLFILGLIALVINIIALVDDKRRDISGIGPILGIISSVLLIFTGITLSLLTMIIFVVAAIFVLREKRINRKDKNI
ncbi:MAG: hypothetical protein ACRDD2_07430 [Sarcina sp.]